MGNTELNDEQQLLLAEMSSVWKLAPSLRFGQLLSHAVEASQGRHALAGLPVTEDGLTLACLKVLSAQLRTSAAKPEADE